MRAVLLIHAWVIPELYAARGAGVVRAGRGEGKGPERVALGLLGDLVDHRARAAVLDRQRLADRGGDQPVQQRGFHRVPGPQRTRY